MIVCALAIVWLPALAYAANSPLTQATLYYKNEVIAGWSIATAILGAVLAAVWRPPTDLPIDTALNSPWAKFALGIAGGIGAFFYMLHAHNQLVVLHILWALGVSFVTPVAVQLAFPILTDLWLRFLKLLPINKGGSEE